MSVARSIVTFNSKRNTATTFESICLKLILLNGISWFYNEFIRCFHQFVSRIFPRNFSQFKQLKKKTKILLVQNSFFLSLPVEKEIITNMRKTMKRFGISRLAKLSDEIVIRCPFSCMCFVW